ncbi:lipopolysaccharide biosynthesis protein, partial [Methylicorpusculum sp.]|uniref:lipopolysaccharide biosynthesis protein n=1 Tax=Methylicorpusculum sp. TaxID=2713644 RepID=UPI002AB9F5F2
MQPIKEQVKQKLTNAAHALRTTKSAATKTFRATTREMTSYLSYLKLTNNTPITPSFFLRMRMAYCGYPQKSLPTRQYSWLSPVIKNFLIYSSGTLVLKSISLVLMPFVLHVLPPAQYGLLSLSMSFTNILVIISGLGLRQTFGIEFFHGDSAARRRMANDIIALYLTINIPLFLLAILNLPLLNRFLFLGTASTTLMLLCLAYCFLQFFTELFYQLLRYQCKALTLTTLQIGTALATITLNLFFLYHFPWGTSGMLFGYVLGTLITFFVALRAYLQSGCVPANACASLKRNLSFSSLAGYLRTTENMHKGFYYLRLSLPFIPGMLFNWVLVAGNRWLLARYGTLHDVGIYSLADTFGQLYYTLILYPMAGSYLPHLMHQFAQNKNDIAAVEHHNRRTMYLSM